MASIAPSGSEASTRWSNCSAVDMEESFKMYPSSEACLFNEPTVENITHVPLTGMTVRGQVLLFGSAMSHGPFPKNLAIFSVCKC